MGLCCCFSTFSGGENDSRPLHIARILGHSNNSRAATAVEARELTTTMTTTVTTTVTTTATTQRQRQQHGKSSSNNTTTTA